MKRELIALLLAFVALLPVRTASAALLTYSSDASTLHLWHLDENAAPANDVGTSPLSLPVLSGGATLGDSSLTGFGTALNTIDSGLTGSPASTDAYLAPFTLVNAAGDNTVMTYASAASGAFTFEALIRPDVDLTQTFAGTLRGVNPMHIFSGEQDGSGGGVRAWQLRIDPIGFNPNADGVTVPLTAPALEFINVNNGVAPVQNRVVFLPTTGANAVAAGQWYHVAVSYNGAEATANNLSIYWTLAAASRTTADLLVQRQLDTDLPLAGTGVDFSVGNIGRTTPNSNFIGLIDEIRISAIDRAAGDFIFQVPEPGTAALSLLAFGAFARRRRMATQESMYTGTLIHRS